MKTPPLIFSYSGQGRRALPLQELGLVNKRLLHEHKLKVHAICVALFLVFGHIAMITGMLDPTILGYKDTNAHEMAEDHLH